MIKYRNMIEILPYLHVKHERLSQIRHEIYFSEEEKMTPLATSKGKQLILKGSNSYIAYLSSL
jgi:hypothetical protein